MPKPLVLVVEDDENTRSALLDNLHAEGYDAIGVPNGAMALQKIRGGERRPDLVLLDLRMPVLNGWEFLAVRDRDPLSMLIPVIVLSADDTTMEIHADAVLRKPCDFTRLSHTITRVLDEARADPHRLPRRTEPWSVAPSSPDVIRNAFGHIVCFVADPQKARRIVAAVNGTSQISTDALEAGIIDKGLDCLHQLHRYETEPDFRKECDSRSGMQEIAARRAEIAEFLARTTSDSSKPS